MSNYLTEDEAPRISVYEPLRDRASLFMALFADPSPFSDISVVIGNIIREMSEKERAQWERASS